jgi:hypothetical protein
LVLVASLLAVPALADVVIPGQKPRAPCTIEGHQRSDNECHRCRCSQSTGPARCRDLLADQGFTRRCRQGGATVWFEVWCRDVTPESPPLSPELIAALPQPEVTREQLGSPVLRAATPEGLDPRFASPPPPEGAAPPAEAGSGAPALDAPVPAEAVPAATAPTEVATGEPAAVAAPAPLPPPSAAPAAVQPKQNGCRVAGTGGEVSGVALLVAALLLLGRRR